ncbi:MAG: flagellar basal-body MS-ring/collar protein FliF [Bryobacteraceae bacterium]|jgi:flagellar M-ring protein FliF
MDQIKNLIGGLSLKQRIQVIMVAALVVAAVVAFVHYRHEADFRPLYTGMAPEDAAGVVQKLRESGVEYRLDENGGAVTVPSQKLAESRLALAAAGLPKSGRIGFELFDKSNFGATEFVEHINYKRALEGELERSVMSLAEVEQARVHLSLPKDSVFLDQQQPAKASVVVKLRPGAELSSQNVLAVTNLVASAVEGLGPDAVSLVDMDGALLSRPKRASADPDSVTTSESLELRQEIERNLVAKIDETLQPLLGANAFRAGASVDYDLTSGEQQEETLDPTHSVMSSSQKTEDVTERASISGVPGTAANLPQQPPSSAKGATGVSRRTENVTYQTSRVIRHTRIPQGVVRRMSLAVLVDQSVRWEGQGSAKQRVLVPPSAETLKTIRDLVAGVTGFNAERGDQLIVETLPFESSLKAAPPQPVNSPKPVKNPPWLEFVNKYRDLWAPVGLGLAVLLVVVRTVFALSRRRGFPPEPELAAGLEAPAAHAELSQAAVAIARGQAAAARPEPNEMGDRIRPLVKRDPAITANVLRLWLQEHRSAAEASFSEQKP